MHLHDRHGAHLTSQTNLKQARQSAASGPADGASADFPYSQEEAQDPRGFMGFFVNIR
jgi:hypothetical protein